MKLGIFSREQIRSGEFQKSAKKSSNRDWRTVDYTGKVLLI